jgi:hypothetical protein
MENDKLFNLINPQFHSAQLNAGLTKLGLMLTGVKKKFCFLEKVKPRLANCRLFCYRQCYWLIVAQFKILCKILSYRIYVNIVLPHNG